MTFLIRLPRLTRLPRKRLAWKDRVDGRHGEGSGAERRGSRAEGPRVTARPSVIALFAMLASAFPSVAWTQSASFERPPIDYLGADVHDRVAKLSGALEAGEIELAYDEEHGYLPAVLAALDVPADSQTLVFSKTSLQLHRISPRRPRALYFNDDVYVGWCQNGDVLEFAATDPQQGAIFYSLEQSSERPPRIVRDRGQCLSCHASSRTQGVPGYLVRSVHVDAAGYPMLGTSTYTTDHTSPFPERWGGWYVTGTHGEMRHMGNVISREEGREVVSDVDAGANRETLEGLVNTNPYLSPHSDLVALMVLEHQTQMHNAIAAANYETREALHQSAQMNELLDRDPDTISDSATRRIDAAAERVLRHLLMVDEFPLTAEVAGTSGFAEGFTRRGVRDSEGRSLRDLDLRRRLFRHPCSYLIRSPAFAGLPDEVRSRILGRLVTILDGDDDTGDFDHLSRDDRVAVRAILDETHPEFAAAR